GGAMSDDHHAGDTEQMTTAVSLGVEAGAYLIQGRLDRLTGSGLEMGDGIGGECYNHPGGSFHGLEEDVAREAIGDDDVGPIAADVAALDISDEVEMRGAEEPEGGPLQIATLALLFTVGQQPHPGLVHR